MNNAGEAAIGNYGKSTGNKWNNMIYAEIGLQIWTHFFSNYIYEETKNEIVSSGRVRRHLSTACKESWILQGQVEKLMSKKHLITSAVTEKALEFNLKIWNELSHLFNVSNIFYDKRGKRNSIIIFMIYNLQVSLAPYWHYKHQLLFHGDQHISFLC